MDLLSRGLQQIAEKGILRGACVAHSAPPVTNCLFANDLLLFGAATFQEAQNLMQILQAFSKVSGQQVGPDKSHIWYSRCITIQEEFDISNLFWVPPDSHSVKYVGAVIETDRGAYDYLVEKVVSRLQTWKGRLLSQAGRLVMIKSVLTALPLYHMATIKFPSRVTKVITKHIMRFFWGKWEDERYMAYAAWHKITIPMDLGGLGVKDLFAMNDALVMKFLWKIASQGESQWISLLKAKYLPRSSIWQSKITYRCSLFWRSIMNQRDALLPMVIWAAGDGSLCTVFAQPWFPGSVSKVPQNRAQQLLTLKDMLLESGQWDVTQLTQFFGFQHCVLILGKDKLIFLGTANGSFFY